MIIFVPFLKKNMSRTKGFIYGSLSAATYGLIPLFTLPVIAKGVGLDTILTVRFLVASFALGGVMMLRKESFRVSRRELKTLLLLGGMFALSAMFLFWSYTLMSAGIASTILFLYPVFVAILMATLFHEKVSWLTSLSILIALTGVALLYLGDEGGTLSLSGIAVVLTSALTYALYIIVINQSNVRNLSGQKITFYAMVVAMCLFFVKAQFSGGLQPIPDGGTWMNLVLLGVIPTVVSCVAMVLSVQYIGSTYTAVLGAMEPLTAVGVGIVVFREPFTPNLAGGIVLIITAVTLIILSPMILKSLYMLRHAISGHLLKR